MIQQFGVLINESAYSLSCSCQEKPPSDERGESTNASFTSGNAGKSSPVEKHAELSLAEVSSVLKPLGILIIAAGSLYKSSEVFHSSASENQGILYTIHVGDLERCDDVRCGGILAGVSRGCGECLIVIATFRGKNKNVANLFGFLAVVLRPFGSFVQINFSLAAEKLTEPFV